MGRLWGFSPQRRLVAPINEHEIWREGVDQTRVLHAKFQPSRCTGGSVGPQNLSFPPILFPPFSSPPFSHPSPSFSLYDLPDYCNDLHTKLYIYADDTKLYRHIFYTADQDKLQNDIHSRLNGWANEWQLKLNVDKCCRMTYTASISNLCDTKYYYDNG